MDSTVYDCLLFVVRHTEVQRGIPSQSRTVYGPWTTITPAAECAVQEGIKQLDQLVVDLTEDSLQGIFYGGLYGGLNVDELRASPFPRTLETAIGFCHFLSAVEFTKKDRKRHSKLQANYVGRGPATRTEAMKMAPMRRYREVSSWLPQGTSSLFESPVSVETAMAIYQTWCRWACIPQHPTKATLDCIAADLEVSVAKALEQVAINHGVSIANDLADFAMPSSDWWGKSLVAYKESGVHDRLASGPLGGPDLARVAGVQAYLRRNLPDQAHPVQIWVTHDSPIRALVAGVKGLPMTSFEDLRAVGTFPPETMLEFRGRKGKVVSSHLPLHSPGIAAASDTLTHRC